MPGLVLASAFESSEQAFVLLEQAFELLEMVEKLETALAFGLETMTTAH